jgi:hypothetical protein
VRRLHCANLLGDNSANTPVISDNNGQLPIAYQSGAQDLTAGDASYSAQLYLTSFSLDSSGAIEANTLSTKLVSADCTGYSGVCVDGDTQRFLAAVAAPR